MLRSRHIALVAGFSTLVVSAFTPAVAGPAAVNFRTQVKPILSANCVGCHNAKNAGGKLDLSSKAGIQKGGLSGKVYVAGKGSTSLIVKRLKGKGGALMPMGGDPLKASQINLITRWINEGGRM